MSARPLVVYSPRYAVDYGPECAFAARKFALAAGRLAGRVDFVEPEPPSCEDLLRAHSAGWLDKIESGRLSPEESAVLELPFSPEIARAHLLAAGGTILAARHALERGVGLHCGGGSHHAFRDRGEGFCAVNDLAAAALKALAEGWAGRVAVLDLDVHQGNGTAAILAGEPRAYTLSLHQADLYPFPKERSSLDIEFAAGAGDESYLPALDRALEEVLGFKPGLVLYQAGVDGWEKDRLGGLRLSEAGLARRDRVVKEALASGGIPVAVVLGGGYGPSPEDTARLHARTLAILAGLEEAAASGPKAP